MHSDMNTCVSIAIPIYNAEDYLAFAIHSVINQTYKDWQLLLMCDGSTDNSTAIANEYAEKDSRIKVVDDGINRGLVYRLNQSVQMSSSKYYARMDADDIMYVTRIEEQVRYLEEHPEVDVVGASIMTIDNENNIIGSGYSEGKVSGFVHPTVMGKTEWFKTNPYSDWALRAEDTELWTRTCGKSVFHAIGKPLLFYREFGVPTFRKYYLSQLTLLKIFRRYTTYEKPFIWFVSNTFKTYLKIIVYYLFDKVGKLDYLISKRGRIPVPRDLQLSKKDLEESIARETGL